MMIRTTEFLSAFRRDGEMVHLRTFKPKKATDTPANSPQKWTITLTELTANRDLQRQLKAKNQYCGLYFVINPGGDNDSEIKRFAAWFAENDALPISEQHARLDAAPIKPSIRVETRNSVHAYWLVGGDCSEAEWREIQERLIAYFNSDPKIKNPSRVMRLPNFDHIHVNGSGPERKKVTIHTFDPDRRYTVEQMREAFPLPTSEKFSKLLPSGPFEYHEDRHAELCQRIMARGKRNSKGNWDTRAICHNGSGDKGLVYFPKTGAVVCNNDPKCSYFDTLRAFGLPDKHLPSSEHAAKVEKQTDAKEQAAKRGLKVYSAGELNALEFSPLRWAIVSLLAEGLFILAGRPKLGKSWLVLNFAISIASGGYALGTIRVDAGDVLYCALEDGARRLQQRLRKALGRGSVPENLYFATEWRTFDRGGLEDLEEWIKAHPNVRLIVFDTLERVRPSEDPKARIYHSDYAAVQGLQDLAKKYGVCILVVHHTRKAEANDHLDLVSGSTGLTGAADGVLVLKRARGEADATLTANGRDFPDTELALKFDGELCDWRALGDAGEYRLSNERRDMIALLSKSGPLTPKEVSVLTGKDHNAVKKLLWTMAQDGEVHAGARGRYSLINTRNPGNPVSERLPADTNGNRSGNRKNHEKQADLQEKVAGGYPVTTVTGVMHSEAFTDFEEGFIDA
jgi:hypothetical protein